MLRSRTSAVSKDPLNEQGSSLSADTSSELGSNPTASTETNTKRRRRLRRKKKKSRSGGGITNAITCLLSFAFAISMTALSYTKIVDRLGRNMDKTKIVKTKHLRDSSPRHGATKGKKILGKNFSQKDLEEIIEERADDIVPEDSIYSMTYPSLNHVDIHNEHFSLSAFAGRVALVINVASEWGKTDLSYDHMKQMLEKHTSYGRKSISTSSGSNGTVEHEIGDDVEVSDDPMHDLVILAFPTNDFHQETGTNEEIKHVVEKHMGEQYHNPNFVLFHKSTLAHNPIYKMLKKHMPESEVKQNFFKYLVGRDGVPVGFYSKKKAILDFELEVLDELETL